MYFLNAAPRLEPSTKRNLVMAGGVLAICLLGMDPGSATAAIHQTVEAAKLSFPYLAAPVISGEIMTAYGATLCTMGGHFAETLSSHCFPHGADLKLAFGDALTEAGTTVAKGRELCSSISSTGLAACRQWIWAASATSPAPLTEALAQTVEMSASQGSFFSQLSSLKTADVVQTAWSALQYIGGLLIAVKGFEETAKWTASYARKADSWLGCSKKVKAILKDRFPGFTSKIGKLDQAMPVSAAPAAVRAPISDGDGLQTIAGMLVKNTINKHLDEVYSRDPMIRGAIDRLGPLTDLKLEIGNAMEKSMQTSFPCEKQYAKIDNQEPVEPDGLSIGP